MKLHLYPADEITQSVLSQEPITSACGNKKVLTRADLDAAANPDRKVCKECSATIAARALDENIVIRQRGTWTDHLEREAQRTTHRFTVDASSIRAWDYTGTWGGQS